MLSQEIAAIERENRALKETIRELKEKMERAEVPKPKSCQFCKNYVQHYIKGGVAFTSKFVPIDEGHCVSRVPIGKGRKRQPSPEDTCPFFELGTENSKFLQTDTNK